MRLLKMPHVKLRVVFNKCRKNTFKLDFLPIKAILVLSSLTDNHNVNYELRN